MHRLAAEERRSCHRQRNADRARAAPRTTGFVHGLIGRFAKQLYPPEADLVQRADEAIGSDNQKAEGPR